MLRVSIEQYIVVIWATSSEILIRTATASSTAPADVAAATSWLIIMLLRVAYNLLKDLMIQFHRVFVDLHEFAEISFHRSDGLLIRVTHPHSDLIPVEFRAQNHS